MSLVVIASANCYYVLRSAAVGAMVRFVAVTSTVNTLVDAALSPT